jgi:hypothetical protein
MPEQPRDPRHYEMKIPPEPDQATLKKEDLKKPLEDENKYDSNTAKDTSVVREGDKPQAARGGK